MRLGGQEALGTKTAALLRISVPNKETFFLFHRDHEITYMPTAVNGLQKECFAMCVVASISLVAHCPV